MKSKFLKNTGWIIGGKIFQMLISLVVSTITARYLGPSNYGIISYTNAYITFFSSICTLGLNGIIVKEIIVNRESEGEIIGTAIIMRIFSSIISMMAIGFIIRTTNPNDNVIYTVAMLQAIGIVFASFDTINYWYQSALMSKIPTIIQSFAYVVMTIYRIIILIQKKDVEWFAFAVSLDTIVIAVLLLLSYYRNKKHKLLFRKTWIGILLKQSYPIIIAGIMSTVYSQMDRIMIGKMLDQEQVGLYSIAVTIAGLWSFIPVAFLDSARPVVMEAKTSNEELYIKRLKQLYAFILWLSFLYSIFMTVFSKIIIKVLYGNSYMEAHKALVIVVWYCAFSYLGSAKNIWIICEKKMRYETVFTTIGAATNLILNFLLIPKMGIEGAAIATLITQIVTNYLILFVFKETRKNAIYISEALVLRKVISLKELRAYLGEIKNKRK